MISLVILSAIAAPVVGTFDLCRQWPTCVACTESGVKCGWRIDGSGCHLRTSLHNDADLVFDDTCPMDYDDASEIFLPNWMGNIMSVIGDAPLLNLSLPGTHDTLTFDLSLTVSDGGIDEYYKLAELLHNYTAVVPDVIEDFMRSGAQTQDLTVTQQLDAGIRFLDIRMMLEYTETPPVWYSLHMLESIGTSVQYFKDIRAWMDVHPAEVVVMWLSKHGSECSTGNDQYPNVSIQQKQDFWKEILGIFDGLSVDFSVTNLNETPVREMITRGHRAVFYVADYVEMTGYTADGPGSYYALDSCLIDNQLGNPDGPEAVQWQRDIYMGANARKATDKIDQKFFLLSLAGGMDYVNSAILKFGAFDKIPSDDAEIVEKCAATYNIPGMNWCPETLLDGSQITNYYAQVAMDETIDRMITGDNSYGLPNAIYINAIGSIGGTMRTGTEVLWGKNRSPEVRYAKQGFSYVDTFVLYNVLNICNYGNGDAIKSDDCQKYIDQLVDRRAANPMTLWDDAVYGRVSSW